MKKIGIAMCIIGAIAISIVLAIWIMSPPFLAPEPDFPEPESSVSEVPTIFEPIIFTGFDNTKTAPFEITTKEWTIDWSYVPSPESSYAFFRLFIYPRGETLWSVESVISPRQLSGTTYSYAGPGEYYAEIDIININSWEIIIKPA